MKADIERDFDSRPKSVFTEVQRRRLRALLSDSDIDGIELFLPGWLKARERGRPNFHRPKAELAEKFARMERLSAELAAAIPRGWYGGNNELYYLLCKSLRLADAEVSSSWAISSLHEQLDRIAQAAKNARGKLKSRPRQSEFADVVGWTSMICENAGIRRSGAETSKFMRILAVVQEAIGEPDADLSRVVRRRTKRGTKGS